MFKIIRKADIILFFALLAFGILLSWISVRSASSGGQVLIRVHGKEYGTYSLHQDRTVTVKKDGHRNVIKIQDGQVWMESSTCKNQICVHEGKISRTNQSIICLPNEVSVEIIGGRDGYDAFS
ncbi:MAG: NusG domain II-containing protein [Eubacteriales bacterium]|nr:NusG domain II-containing protein [Eubacteriales bacterium]